MSLRLPVAGVIAKTKGLGPLGLIGIVGEAGDISAYRSVQAVWKRLGLAVIDGERQGRRKDKDEAELHGYSPQRRSVMWNVGSSLVGSMGHGPRPKVGEDVSRREDLSRWQKIYIERMRYEVARDPSQSRPAAVKDGTKYESFSKHASNRARRYVEKQFLKYLFREWRQVARKGDGAAAHLEVDQPMGTRPPRRPSRGKEKRVA
jgi:hypothetical protein